MANDDLVLLCIPSLSAVLMRAEQAKGSPLEEKEVIRIRDESIAVALPREVAEAIAKRRGYEDIDPENCWDEWQQIRLNLGQYISFIGKDLIKFLDVDAMTAELENYIAQLSECPSVTAEDGKINFEFKESGVALRLDADQKIRVIFLYSKGLETFEQYKGPMPFNLNYEYGKEDILKKFGTPAKYGGGQRSAILNSIVPFWVRYDFADWSLHIQFKPDLKAIALLTLMSPQSVPK